MIIETVKLTRIFIHGPSNVTAVNNVHLQVKEGSFVCIVGPSGSGKTTLLNLIGLNDYPTSGKLFFYGKDTSFLTARQRRQTRLHQIGFVFQTFNLLPTLSAVENVELPMAFAGVSLENQREKALRLLAAVGLSHRVRHRPKELSLGEMQRVAIARALVNDPPLILADEPTGELDSQTGSEIMKLLLGLCKENKRTVVIATHAEEIVKMADAAYKIRDGSLVS